MNFRNFFVLISVQLLLGTIGCSVFASSPLPDPCANPRLIQWCERFYWQILRSWNKNQSRVKDVSCIFELQNDGYFANARIFEASRTDMINKAALKLLMKSCPFEKPSKPWGTPPAIVVQFYRYPEIRLSVKDGEKLLPCWPLSARQAIVPSIVSDAQLIDSAFDHSYYPLEMWFKEKQPPWKMVSCLFTIGGSGEISDLKIYRSSGLPSVDAAAIDSITSHMRPFNSLLRPLRTPQEVIVQFYPTQELRVKLKKGNALIPIGRSASYPDPD